MCRQLSLFPEKEDTNARKVKLFNLDDYDIFVVSFSGGKDSLCNILKLKELGVPNEKIQLWHQGVDGEPGTPLLMDWPVTENYVRAAGKAMGMKTCFQWRKGGFKAELLRENGPTGDVQYLHNGVVTLPTTRSKNSTRRRFPAKSPNLSIRWCSASLKVDVFARVLSNHPDFKGSPEKPLKVLVLSGERRQESPARAKYLEAELHRCSTKSRIVHSWRSVIDYSEEKIWDLIEKHRIVPHPAYLLGWGRTSCASCIYCIPDYWACMREILPGQFNQLVELEKELNFTIDHKYTLTQMANMGSIKRMPKDVLNSRFIQKALKGDFSPKDFFTEKWELPAGAFRGAAGGPA